MALEQATININGQLEGHETDGDAPYSVVGKAGFEL